MPDTSVKFLHSAMAGAPSLSGANGGAALIALLDACLVNGFGSGAIDSIVVASGIATVTRSAGHPMEVGSVSLIAGVTPAGLNGEKKVLSVPTPTTYTFDATGISDQTATGTPTHKLAPLGWTSIGSGSVKAYKATDVTGTGCYLRVDDSGTTTANYARVVGYESMSDVNTGTGAFPTAAQMSGGLYWPKSSAVDATTRPWILAGDGRLFYLMVAYSGTTSASFASCSVFGDFLSNKSPDAYGCLVNGFNSSGFGTSGANPAFDYDGGDTGTSATALYLARSYTGLGSAVLARKAFPILFGGSTTVRSGAAGLPFPNFADGGLYVAQHFLAENATTVYRGLSPGFFCSQQNVGASVFSNRDSVTGVTGLAGRTLKAINSNSGVFFIDATGPWR